MYVKGRKIRKVTQKPLVAIVDRKVEEFNKEQDKQAEEAMLAALSRRGMKARG